MRGVTMNSTLLHPCCFPLNDTQKFHLHNGYGIGQSAVHLMKKVPRLLVCQKDKISRRNQYSALCMKEFHQRSIKNRGLGRVYGSPPNTPVRETHVQDGEEEDDNPEVPKSLDTASTVEEGASTNFWKNLAPRYRLILTTAFAFVICNMDKVNMSVAIIPMSQQLGWNSTTAGLVQSSFFWGYALSQLPGGWLAKAFSGQRVLRAGVLIWSLATAAVPGTAKILPGLLFCRLLVGLGEGVSPAAATDLIARTLMVELEINSAEEGEGPNIRVGGRRAMPVSERSRSVATVFGGLNVGSVIGLLLAPVIIERFGWESVFYIFGLLGVIWCLLFEGAVGSTMLGNGTPSSTEMPGNSSNGVLTNHNGDLRQRQIRSARESNGKSNPAVIDSTSTSKKVPWKAFFKSPAVWAMIYAHFCGNWGHYTLLSWFPTYLSAELNLDLTHAALVSILPPLASVAVNSVAAPLADHFISRGYDITMIRKVCQSVAFLSPAACMAIAAFTPNVNPWVDVAILTSGLGLSSFTLAGLYCTHQDISPKYASILLGITNTVGAIPGVLGVALVGIIYDRTHSWNLALFAPSIFFYLTGIVVWNIFASSKPQNFES